ncbi:hypothetical protein F0U62_34040 [Cystobacter fuscus]|uniref:hypothetical protein n=1 Tax=Cystobacter fuscus TaxID=43 RepID=UPI002B2FD6CF|nr:hypothetical protein F0U62_34040 [Cystobacter fuscus]
MQLRKMTLMIAALGLALTACPGGGREDLSCTADTDCSEDGTEICHPQAKVCVQTCTASTDCPDSAKSCEAISSSNTQKICKCSTDALCQTDERVTDASTLSCDKTYSVCKSTGMTTPPGATCTGSGQSTCAYGQFCSGGTCTAAPEAAATCENFSQNRPNWSAASSNGPVIYSVTGTDYQVGSAYCQSDAPNAFIVRVRAYRTDADWPSTRAGLSGFFYVTTGSDKLDVVNRGLLVPNTGYNRTASNPKDAEFNVYLCRPSNAQTIQVGFYFTGGNPVCENINS